MRDGAGQVGWPWGHGQHWPNVGQVALAARVDRVGAQVGMGVVAHGITAGMAAVAQGVAPAAAGGGSPHRHRPEATGAGATVTGAAPPGLTTGSPTPAFMRPLMGTAGYARATSSC